jgi:hypothetical protein
MSARSISRVARTGFAAGALTVALSVPALAVPARDSSGAPVPGAAGVRATPTANASGNVTAGTDVAAPDQQAPIVASHNVTTGTDVAAPDQQNPVPAPTKPIIPSAPTWPENPVPLAQPQNVSASPSGGFQWDDAGIGAGGAVVIALTAIGGVLILRRRQTPGTPLAA